MRIKSFISNFLLMWIIALPTTSMSAFIPMGGSTPPPAPPPTTGGSTGGATTGLLTLSPIWSGTFSSTTDWTKNNWGVNSLPKWGTQDIQVMASTSANPSPKGDNYLRINYPIGSADSQSAPPLGGAQFYGAMINSNGPITLSFYIRYPLNFPFKGTIRPETIGKLPGLFSGTGNTGSNVPTGYDGWTTRYMWCDVKSTGGSVIGGGEVLQFTFGSNQGLFSSIDGTFLGCGKWQFSADNKWHNIQQTIHLNDPGKANGRIDVCYDGKLVLSQQNIIFRLTPSLMISGILFQTFFGGGSKQYATPISTYADFADFALYNYPATAAPGQCIKP